MGHIEKRTRVGKSGAKSVSWRARYRTPTGAERVRTFGRKLDAERFLAEIEADKLRGAWVDPRLARMTVGELAEQWWATTAPLKATTRRDYRLLLDRQVLPAFGDLPLAAVDQLAIRAWVASMIAGGLSPSRTRHAFHVLSAVLAAAVAAGRLARNPAKGVRLPRAQRREMQFLTAAQVEAIATAITEPYPVLVRFAAYTGLRAGELVALRVRHLDLLRGVVHVLASTSDLGTERVTGPTKTYETRMVQLPRFLRAELAAYLAGRPHGADELVFTGPNGGELIHNSFYQHRFRPAAARAGLDPVPRFHDLRHTCASLLIAQGASIKAVQAHLGHASAVVTLDRYGHLFPSELEHLADRLDEVHADAVGDGQAARRRRPSRLAHRRPRPRRDPRIVQLRPVRDELGG